MPVLLSHKRPANGAQWKWGCVGMRTVTQGARCAVLSMVFLCCCLLAATSRAEEPALRQFDIGAENLSTALNEFARQSQQQILFAPEVVSQKLSTAVRGKMQPLAALKLLLKDSGLKFTTTPSGAILVGDPNTLRTVPTSAPTSSQIASGQGSLVAQTNPVAASTGNSTTTQDQAVPVTAEESKKAKDQGLTEIVVTGTHIRGVAPLSPIKTITNQDLADQGYTRLDQAFEQLPENFKDGSSQESNGTLGIGAGYQFNPSFASGVNLFGLGVGTTLILLNGERLAPTGYGSHVDISGIPTSAIDRVEIVEDGASAVYGSDAVGGVVNVITRKDFNGLETGARLTSISAGKTPNYGGYALAGTSWDSGNVIANFDYEKDSPLLADSRSFTSDLAGPLYLLPEDRNYRLYVSARQTITDQLSLSSQVLIPYREFASYSNLGSYVGVASALGSELQPSVSLQLAYEFSADWGVTLSGNYAEDRFQYQDDYSVYPLTDAGEERNKSTAGQVRINGSLFGLPGGTARVAIGGEFRTESYLLADNPIVSGVPSPSYENGQRHIDSGYAEILLPVVGEDNGIPLVREFAIDGAGRYDRYSDFGSTTNPMVTLKWTLVDGLSFHASYSKSFRAPTFEDLLEGRYLELYPESNPSSPSGVSRTILLDGGNPDLEPERSKSFNAGIEFKPTFVYGLSSSLSYFHFDYTNRIEHLLTSSGFGFSGFLANAGELGSLITLNPTPTQINAAYASVPPSHQVPYPMPPGTPAAIAAIVQVGFVNAAASDVSGVTGNVRYDATSEFGQWTATLDGTLLTKYQQQVAPSAPSFEILNKLSDPLKFRAKAMLGWKWQQLAAYGRVNYANAYQNENDLSCGTSGCPIASWTTFDLGLAYATTAAADHHFTSGLRVGLDVVNAFNRSPPYALTPGSAGNLTYDPINANPLGRAFALTVTKKW